MGRADAAGREHVGVARPAGVDRIDDRRLVVGHHARLGQPDADLAQHLGDVRQVRIDRAAREDLVADDDQARGDRACSLRSSIASQPRLKAPRTARCKTRPGSLPALLSGFGLECPLTIAGARLAQDPGREHVRGPKLIGHSHRAEHWLLWQNLAHRSSSACAKLSGALGDLGTLLPLMLGSIAVVGLAPLPVLAGFAIFYIATAAWYRLPIPVQPMKAVAVVLLTAELSPAALAASGVMLGAALLLLGLTGWITRLARIVPQSVLAGLQLGLGLALALLSLELMATAPLLAILTVGLLVGLLLVPRAPSALIALVAAIVLAPLLGRRGNGPRRGLAGGAAARRLAVCGRAGRRVLAPRAAAAFAHLHQCGPADRAGGGRLFRRARRACHAPAAVGHERPRELAADAARRPADVPRCWRARGALAVRRAQRHGTLAAGPGAARRGAAAGRPRPRAARRDPGGGAGRAAGDGRGRAGAEPAAVRLQAFLLARDRRDGGGHALGRSVLWPPGRLGGGSRAAR